MKNKNSTILLNSLSKNQHFIRSSLYSSFCRAPLNFIDAGTRGGIFPLIMPVASLTHCICFEPDNSAYRSLCKQYNLQHPFAKISIFNFALSNREASKKFYVTESKVNSSLLEPSDELITRYQKMGFKINKVDSFKTQTLDSIISSRINKGERMGEFIKLDCQGAEYDILKGAKKMLSSCCVALFLEVEFFQMYKHQKLFVQVDMLLQSQGFLLYGIYPNYISAKKLDRKECDSEERITWADALYFKDPLSYVNKKKRFSWRDIETLLLTAMLTCYYDFALEIVDRYYTGRKKSDGTRIKDLIISLAKISAGTIRDDAISLMDELSRYPGKEYLYAKKFIDNHTANNTIDFITKINL